MSQKTVVITGANRGIGFEIARQYYAAGWRVVLCARTKEKAERAASSIGEGLIPIELELRSENSLINFTHSLAEHCERVDVLVNNAGVMGSGSILNFDLEEIQEVIDSNLYGAIRACKAVYPFLKKSDSPRIINMSSGMGTLDELSGSHASYRLSKWSLNGFTVMLAHELAAQKIAVNAMCPGWVRTDMGGSSAPRSLEQGADTAFWLGTTPEYYTGKMFRDRKEIMW